jgi:hypothetical protein
MTITFFVKQKSSQAQPKEVLSLHSATSVSGVHSDIQNNNIITGKSVKSLLLTSLTFTSCKAIAFASSWPCTTDLKTETNKERR